MSKYLIQLIEDGSILYLTLSQDGSIGLETAMSEDFEVKGEYKESWATAILAGFEETGFRLIREL